MSKVMDKLKQQFGQDVTKTGDPGDTAIMQPQPQQNTVSVEEVMAELQGTQTEPEEQPIETKFGKFKNKEELDAYMEDLENKRRGFQSEADQAKALLEQHKQMSQYQQSSVQQEQPEQPVRPDMKEYLKSVDQDDPDSKLEAMAKYYEALRTYDSQVLQQQIDAKIEEARRQEQIMARARALAAKDPRFRLEDGSPNLYAINQFLINVMDDWGGLYDKLNPTPAKTKDLVGTPAENITTVSPKLGATVASSGNGAPTEPPPSKVPNYVKEFMKRHPERMILPPGIKFVK